MKKSQSLKGRKFNIIIPKPSLQIPEKISNKNSSKIIIKTIAEYPDLYLPIKKLPHNHFTNKKHKNKKENQISLEKLKQIILNLKVNKNESNKNKPTKNAKIISLSPNKKNLNNQNSFQMISDKDKTNLNTNTNSNNDNLNTIEGNNSKINNISEINLNKSNSLEVEMESMADFLQMRNKEKEKKWYNNIQYLTEKYNELILTTENLEKNLINKYLDGTDNIILEMEEPQFLKEDTEINTINVNASLRKHLSIRETTLGSSGQNSHYNNTDKLKAKVKGLIFRIKNKKKFKKYKTNFTIKSIKENNKNKINNKEYRKKNEHKRKKKLPIFNKSLSKINNQNICEEKNANDININISHDCYHFRNISYDKENREPFFSLNEIKKRYRNSSSFNKNKINKLDEKIKNPSLDIIKEKIDNINNESNDKVNQNHYRKQSAKIVYDLNKSKRKGVLRGFTPKNKNIHSSEKNLNNYKQKMLYYKNKYNINKNKDLFENDKFFLNFKNSKSLIDDYIISSDLGIGSYAKVKLGIHKVTKEKYAIKIYDKNLIDDEEKKNTIKNEIFILKQLNNENENVMKLYDVINTDRNLYLILEYINGISLLEYIQREKNRRIDENECKIIFAQIVKAIIYCQKKNICHRDIKLENIIILNDKKIKLIDFGFAIKCNRNEYQQFFCGTLYYMAPEIVNKQKYIPFFSDIWSLGVLLYAMIYGNFPFRAKTEEKLFELINEAKLFFPDYVDASSSVKNLISKIIVINPKERISLEEIMNDDWFKNE